jgi:hypothetical protein
MDSGILNPQTFSLTQDTTFYLTVTDLVTGVSKMDSVRIQVYVGINDVFAQDDVKIYPNPCKTSTTVEVPMEEEFSLTIINTYGQIIQSVPSINNRYVVNTANYPKGLYFFVLQNANGKITKKVVVQ